MANDEEVFRFMLNESLYFEKGQEVAEMLGVSLEPEISIQPYHDYISIRGIIELQGSYQKENASYDDNVNIADFNDHHAKRYMEEVVDSDDNQAEFTHRFPVEISVPLYRINSLDDVMVNIESFDYEIPDPNQLKLNAAIEIYGISDRAEKLPEATRENDFAPLPEEESFEFELKKEKESSDVYEQARSQNDIPGFSPNNSEAAADSSPETDKSSESINEKNRTDLTLDSTSEKEGPDSFSEITSEESQSDFSLDSTKTNTEKEQSNMSKDRWKHKKSQTLAEFFNHGTDNKEVTDEQQYDEKSLYESSSYESYPPSVTESSNFTIESSEYLESAESRTEEPEDVRYLADIFRNEEEESYTKMRLCIVQPSDTVESIASRYEVPALQLVKQNNLTEESIEEGQLLYIPHKKKN